MTMYLDGCWFGYRLTEQNTFVEVLDEDVVFRRRRNSAPELIWRYGFSPPGQSMTSTTSISSCETTATSAVGDSIRRTSLASTGSCGSNSTFAESDDDISRRRSTECIGSCGTKAAYADNDDDTPHPPSTTSSGSCGVGARFPTSYEAVINGSGVCNLMIKNIPCSCGMKDFVKLIAERGFMKLCSSLYIPSKSGKILGYAFIGFPYPILAEAFVKCFHGFKVPRVNSKKILSIVPASSQPDRDLQHFKGNGVMNTKSLFRGQSEVSMLHKAESRM